MPIGISDTAWQRSDSDQVWANIIMQQTGQKGKSIAMDRISAETYFQDVAEAYTDLYLFRKNSVWTARKVTG